MARIALFTGIREEDQFELLNRYFVTRRYQPGDTIVQRHDPGTELLIIRSGTAYAKVSNDIRVDFGAGDAFGEVCLVDEGYRSVSVFAEDLVETSVMSREMYNLFKLEMPEQALVFLQNIASVMAARLRQTNTLARANERKFHDAEVHRIEKEHTLWDRLKEILTRNY
jgi:SulP family sulfate permease